MAIPFCIPPAMDKRSGCSVLVLALILSVFKNLPILNRCLEISNHGLIHISLMTNDTEHLWMCLFIIHIFSWVKYLFKCFAHFLIVLFSLNFEFFLYSGIKTFVRYVTWKCSLLVCSFFSSYSVFCRANVFNFDVIQFINFSFFIDYAFGVMSKHFFFNPRSGGFYFLLKVLRFCILYI